MNPLILVPILAAGFFLIPRGSDAERIGGSMKRLYDLPDIEPENQGGNYKKDFDPYFESCANEFGVPFALLKAHAIKESSLNPKAYRDENPSKRTDRIGWASRGLMQLLFWPGSDRFAKYGFPKDSDPDELYEPYENIRIAAQLIRDNLKACGGDLRDAINMYNTGKKEAQYQAPLQYVDKTIGYYETMIKQKIS